MADLPVEHFDLTDEWKAARDSIANMLRTHQFDEGVGDKFPGRCFCGTQMGDQEEHQAIALLEAGWINPTRGHTL